jgi:hypothetical protein
MLRLAADEIFNGDIVRGSVSLRLLFCADFADADSRPSRD